MNEISRTLPHFPTAEEMDAQKPFLAEDEWMDVSVDDDVLDVTKDYPICYSLSINGIPFAPLGGLHAMTGQPGHGKTMTLSMVAAAVLGDTTHGMEWLLREEIPAPKVLYIDTEMERGNTAMVHKRICAMRGWDWHTPHDQLTILCLREVVTAVERWKKVLKAIYQFQPTVVILDGLIDVVADFNDNTDCQQIIFKCMSAASHYNISFWTLLHQNPNSEKMVGHAGSFLERKASDVMVTRKVKDEATGEVTFELKNKKVRAKDWEGYLFRVSDSVYSFGLPELVDKTIIEFESEQEDNELKKLDEQFRALDFRANGKSWTELDEDMKNAGIKSNRKKKTMIEQAISAGILHKEEKGRYSRYYYRGLEAKPFGEQKTMEITPENGNPPF